jgi:hypothetical protein
MRHALTHRLHHARGLHAQRGRQLQRIQPGAVVNVDEIHAYGVVMHADFTGPGLADLDRPERHLRRPPAFADSDCF